MFLLGIAIARYGYTYAGLSLLIWLVGGYWRARLSVLVLVGVVTFGAGLWRGGHYVHRLEVNSLYMQKKVMIIGTSKSDAVYGKQQQLSFSMRDARLQNGDRLTGDVAIAGYGEPMVRAGDMVEAVGKLYPRRGNQVAGISFAELKVVQHSSSWVDGLRSRMIAGMRTALPEPVATFAIGLLIGQQSDLPEDIQTQLRHAGLTHIIAVSGYNLTILVTAARTLLEKRSKYQTICTAAFLLVGFLAISGLSPPVMRASVISFLSLWAWYYGRSVPPMVLLLVSAVGTVWINPTFLWGNVSWYLSFLAFCGVLLLSPRLTKRLYGNREPKIIAATIIETICATICVLPYSLFIFGQVSLISLFANVMIVPLVPLGMLFGFVSAMGGMFVPTISGLMAWPAHLLLRYMLDIAQWWGSLKNSFSENIGFTIFMLSWSYVLLTVIYVLLCKNCHSTTSCQCGELAPKTTK